MDPIDDANSDAPAAALAGSPYGDIFLRYIGIGLRQAQLRVAQSPNSLTDAERTQVWHLLDYGLALPQSWEIARDLMLTLTPLMEQAGFRDDWLTYLEKGVEQAAQGGDLMAEAQLCQAAGLLNRLASRHGAAAQWLQRALDGYQRLNDLTGMASAHNQLGRVCYLQNHFQEAKSHAQLAMDLLASVESSPDSITNSERAESHYVLGMTALKLRQYPTAETHHHQALLLRQASGNPRTIAWAYHNMGMTIGDACEYGGAQRHTEAIEWLQQAIEALEQLNDIFHAAMAHNTLGAVFQNMGEFDSAQGHYLHAAEGFRRTGARLHLAQVLNNTGLVYLDQKKPAAAEAVFREAVHIYQELEDDLSRMNSQHGVVLALLAQNRFADAAELCQQSLTEVEVLREIPAQYGEKRGWYVASLARAKQGMA